MTNPCLALLNSVLAVRLNPVSLEFLKRTQEQVSTGVTDDRFTQLISLASRHIPRQQLEPSGAEVHAAAQLIPGWNPKAWSLLEAARVSFVLSRTDLAAADFGDRFNQWFRFADEGEA
jgi:hypothetical protein